MVNSAIVVVNDDINEQIKSVFKRQLDCEEVIDGTEFDARITADPNYPVTAKLNNKTILVCRDLSKDFDRTVVDFVVFFKNGLVSVLNSKYGPPGLTLPLDRIYLNRLIFNK